MPNCLKDIVGQDNVINDILNWLAKWKKGNALLLWGPTGIGKTMIPKTIASEKKWDLVEINASDKRSAKSIKELLSGAVSQQSLMNRGKLILIDEIEGMARSDRGGIGEIVKIIKKSAFPVILTVSQPYVPKFFPLRNVCRYIGLKKISSSVIEKYLIARERKAGRDIDPQEIRKAATASKGDIRAAEIILDTGCSDCRDAETNIFETLRIIFRETDSKKVLDAIKNCDKKAEEIFWWIEENIPAEFLSSKERAEALRILSKADLYKRKHKSWVTILTGFSHISLRRSYVVYKPAKPAWARKPDKIPELHCSLAKQIKEKGYMKFL
jgi:replication factor C large subunit